MNLECLKSHVGEYEYMEKAIDYTNDHYLQKIINNGILDPFQDRRKYYNENISIIFSSLFRRYNIDRNIKIPNRYCN
jgi:hypothetical protein